jgi:hypothetical protein
MGEEEGLGDNKLSSLLLGGLSVILTLGMRVENSTNFSEAMDLPPRSFSFLSPTPVTFLV